MFAPIEPYATGLLAVPSALNGGQSIYWECSGNPEGEAALHLHGGPGVGLLTGHRRRFDPSRFRTVALEQRGCGRSLPIATDEDVSVLAARLSEQTLAQLIEDIEVLRAHLGIERFLVSGVSWGTTLALAYAEAHPERVSGLALMCICLTRSADVHWMTEDVGRLFPEAWAPFERAAERAPGQRVLDAYYALLTSSDPAVRDAAARAWCAWEDAHIGLGPGHRPDPRYEDPAFRRLFATLVVHHFQRREGDAIFSAIDRIAHIPAVLVHGRLDVSSPLETAWQLHERWPASELVVIEHEGHGGEAMVDALVEGIAGVAARS